MQVFELVVHWRSGLKVRGLFASEALAKDAYRLTIQGLSHTEYPPYEIIPRYVHTHAERVTLV